MKDLIQFEKCQFKKTGLLIDESITFEEWQNLGQALQKAGGAIQFWIGDWIRFGESKWGEKYTQAIEMTGLKYQTLRNCKYVAEHLDLSRRRDNLPYSTQAEVASLEPEKQEVVE
jgi:hypothetical protein